MKQKNLGRHLDILLAQQNSYERNYFHLRPGAFKLHLALVELELDI